VRSSSGLAMLTQRNLIGSYDGITRAL